MCGIVGSVSSRNVVSLLIDGLKRLEYRGYDSAGIAILDTEGQINRVRTVGKVALLQQAIANSKLMGYMGIAHTRWATHGKPSENNAHPHMSHGVAVVHNGIIENYDENKNKLQSLGYKFISETDTEVIAHLIHYNIQKGMNLFDSVKATASQLEGSFALGVMSQQEFDGIIAVRKGSPLVIGIGVDENFIASDQLALLPFTKQFIILEEGDCALIKKQEVVIIDTLNKKASRKTIHATSAYDQADKGSFKHYMLKEIFEQPKAITATIEGKIHRNHILTEAFGPGAEDLFKKVENVYIVACGTSFHAALVAKYWIEELVCIPCFVEIASEFRYRKVAIPENSLFITISQSGETADTLAALYASKKMNFLERLTICNVSESTLVRESDRVLLTRAGIEIGVASTKAFTTQLISLLLLALELQKHKNPKAVSPLILQELCNLPSHLEKVLNLENAIKKLAEDIIDKHHALFLGRGIQYPIALEGALKLKEISYIHAEAYAAGELKHGPLALIDKNMPVIAMALEDDLYEKMKSNLSEVKARGGNLFVFSDNSSLLSLGLTTKLIEMPKVHRLIAPIVYTVPLQLLAYYVATLRGTDVDQPRNLAKSVTVE